MLCKTTAEGDNARLGTKQENLGMVFALGIERVSCLKITQDEKNKGHGSELELELLGEAQIQKA